MTPIEAQQALALLDLLLTGVSHVSAQVAQARAEGLITPEQQQARHDLLEALRARLGSPLSVSDPDAGLGP